MDECNLGLLSALCSSLWWFPSWSVWSFAISWSAQSMYCLVWVNNFQYCTQLNIENTYRYCQPSNVHWAGTKAYLLDVLFQFYKGDLHVFCDVKTLSGWSLIPYKRFYGSFFLLHVFWCFMFLFTLCTDLCFELDILIKIKILNLFIYLFIFYAALSILNMHVASNLRWDVKPGYTV